MSSHPLDPAERRRRGVALIVRDLRQRGDRGLALGWLGTYYRSFGGRAGFDEALAELEALGLIERRRVPSPHNHHPFATLMVWRGPADWPGA